MTSVHPHCGRFLPVRRLPLGPCCEHVALLPAPPDCCTAAACPRLPAWPDAARAAGRMPELPCDALAAAEAALPAAELPVSSLLGPSSVASESVWLELVKRDVSVVWLRSMESVMPTKEGWSSVSEPSDGCPALLEQVAWLPQLLGGDGAILLMGVLVVLGLLLGRK